MKILIQMGDSYPDESPCAKRMRTFYDVLTAKGHEVIVLAPRADHTVYDVGKQTAEGSKGVVYCKTVKLKKKTVIYRFLNSYVFAVNSYKRAKSIKDVDVVISTCPPPLINYYGYKIAKYHKAKLVYDVRDIWPDVAWEMGSFSKSSPYSRVFAIIRNFMLKHADMTIAVSPGKVKKLSKYYSKLVPGGNPNVYEITNGLDEDFLTNKENPEVVQRYHLDDRFSAVYIGNIGLAQGLQQLLEVAKKSKEKGYKAHFLLFGSGAQETALKKYKEDNGLDNVEFLGRIPNSDIFTVLRHSKISFVSLVNENLRDSVPTKMFEALGAGCPVLLAACGDSAAILNKTGFGIAVRPNKSDELWDAFEKMYLNIDSIYANREKALQVMLNEYSRQKAAAQLEKLLTSLAINS